MKCKHHGPAAPGVWACPTCLVELREENTRIRASLLAAVQLHASAMTADWQPIETGPVSTLVLAVWRPVDHEQRQFHREIVIGSRCYDLKTYNPDGRFYSGGMYYDEATHITHWKQLPALPNPSTVNP